MRQRVGGGAGFNRPIAFVFEAVDERPANQGFVVNDENGGVGHEPALYPQSYIPSSTPLHSLRSSLHTPRRSTRRARMAYATPNTPPTRSRARRSHPCRTRSLRQSRLRVAPGGWLPAT